MPRVLFVRFNQLDEFIFALGKNAFFASLTLSNEPGIMAANFLLTSFSINTNSLENRSNFM